MVIGARLQFTKHVYIRLVWFTESSRKESYNPKIYVLVWGEALGSGEKETWCVLLRTLFLRGFSVDLFCSLWERKSVAKRLISPCTVSNGKHSNGINRRICVAILIDRIQVPKFWNGHPHGGQKPYFFPVPPMPGI